MRLLLVAQERVTSVIDVQPPTDATALLIDWAASRPAVRAVLLSSTRAIAEAATDVLSDYDVILVVDDIHPFVLNRAWIGDFGRVLVVYWDPVRPAPGFGTEECGNVVQYASGLKIDFSLWPVTLLRQVVGGSVLPQELDAGYRVLVDKDSLTASMRAPTGRAYIPERPTVETYHTVVNDFLSDAPYVAKSLWRDELFPAKWCLDHDMKHKYLRQVLEWRVEIDGNWSLPVGSLGKGLKKRLPRRLWARVARCYAGGRLADNWAALFRTLALFRDVAVDVGQQLGYSYLHELHSDVCTYVKRVRRLRRSA